MRGPAWETYLDEPLDLGGGVVVTASAVSMGNPHLVLFLEDDPERFHVAHIGAVLERDDRFPEGTNVEFARVGPDGDRGARLGAGERGDDGVRERGVRDRGGGARGGPRRSSFVGAVPRWGARGRAARDSGSVLLDGPGGAASSRRRSTSRRSPRRRSRDGSRGTPRGADRGARGDPVGEPERGGDPRDAARAPAGIAHGRRRRGLGAPRAPGAAAGGAVGAPRRARGHRADRPERARPPRGRHAPRARRIRHEGRARRAARDRRGARPGVASDPTSTWGWSVLRAGGAPVRRERARAAVRPPSRDPRSHARDRDRADRQRASSSDASGT